MKKYRFRMILLKIAKYVFFAGISLFIFVKYIYSRFLTEKLANYGITIDTSSVTFWSFVIILGIIVAFLIYFYFRKKSLTIDSAIIPHYDLRETLHASLVGAVIDGSFDGSDFDAGVADLVINGLMTIEEIEVDGEIMQIWKKIPRNKINSQVLFDFKIRRLFYDRLFDMGKGEEFGDDNRPPSFTRKEESQGWFIRNNRNFHIGFVYEDIESEIKSTEYFQNSNLFIGMKVLFGWILLMSLVFISVFNPEILDKNELSLVKLSVIILFFIVFLIFIFKQRSKKGFKLAHYLEGYYDFLETTDLHKLSSQKDGGFQKHFSYAVSFGLVDMWDGNLVKKHSKETMNYLSNNEVEVIEEEVISQKRNDKIINIVILIVVFMSIIIPLLSELYKQYI